jgi:hypothetical protein
MKLELKHLVYQNFKPLQVYFGKGDIDIIVDIEYCNGIIGFLNRNENYLLSQNPFKIILKPISDLDKLVRNEFEKYDAKQKHNEEIINLFCEENGVDEIIENIILSSLPYECVEFMFRNHYDFFGLIEKGLAVSVHDCSAIS